MRFPLPMTTRIAGYVARKRLSRGQEVPHGADARAASRLQLDVHGLRADSGIRIDDQAEAVDRRVPRAPSTSAVRRWSRSAAASR